jgi:hypothetical protein
MTLRLRSNAGVLLAALALLASASPSLGQIPSFRSHITAVPYAQRMDAFRRLLFEFRFQPLKTFGQLRADPAESILIVLGDPKCLGDDRFPDELRQFVEQGGAVLIATDNAVEARARENLVKLAGVYVTGETLVCRSPTEACLYDHEPYCPLVEPIADTSDRNGSANVLSALAAVVGAGGKPSLFRNSHPNEPDLRVATNAPSRLQVQGWFGLPLGIHRLARLPVYCQDEAIGGFAVPFRKFGPRMRPPFPNRPVPMGQQEGPLFAVGGTVGKGRVLVLADHSLFINRMILPRDNGNLEFTANCLHWLRGGVTSTEDVLNAARNSGDLVQLTGQRNKVLFVDDGTIRTNFEVPMKKVSLNPPLGSEPAIVAAVDRTLARLEDQNAFNDNFLDFLDDHDWDTPKLKRGALYLFTFAALLFLGYRFVWRGRHRLDATVPLLASAVTNHLPKTSLLEQRRRAMLRAGNVWETVHQLARHGFESAGISLNGSSMPRLAVDGNWWRRWRVNRRVKRLWQFARGIAPTRVSPGALKRWLSELEAFQIALANGTIRLT